MTIPPLLSVSRHDATDRALLTPTGEIDLTTAPLLRAALWQCLRDGIRGIHVDLTSVTFCDCSGLNVFLEASHRTAAVGGALRLHDPPAMLARLLTLTGSGFLLAAPVLLPGRPRDLAGSAPSVLSGAL